MKDWHKALLVLTVLGAAFHLLNEVKAFEKK
jgi:hypothetical protein